MRLRLREPLFFTRVKQSEWHSLGGALPLDNLLLQQYAQRQGEVMTDPVFLQQIAALLEQQSSMLAFVYSFGFMMVIYLVLILLLGLFKN